jgi:hypothetical protein
MFTVKLFVTFCIDRKNSAIIDARTKYRFREGIWQMFVNVNNVVIQHANHLENENIIYTQRVMVAISNNSNWFDLSCIQLTKKYINYIYNKNIRNSANMSDILEEKTKKYKNSENLRHS